MTNAEEMNEPGNRVVWNNALNEVTLMRPTHRELVSSQLHPNTVDGVFWNDKRLSHNKLVVIIDAQMLASGIDRKVVKGLTALQGKTVGRKHKVVANLVKRGILLAVITGGEEKTRR